jgi:hypothetical protein
MLGKEGAGEEVVVLAVLVVMGEVEVYTTRQRGRRQMGRKSACWASGCWNASVFSSL